MPTEPLHAPAAIPAHESRRIDQARAVAMRALVPPPRLSLPEWIEANIRLPEDVSAVPGRLRLTTPQRGIAEAIGDPGIERVTLVKPVRVGLSTLITSTIASFVANEPSPILALLPAESDCRDYVVSDLEPIFAASPALRGLLSAEADADGRNTLLSRRFAGGSLKVVAAKSPRNLRRHNVRVLLIDEADAMEPGPEGSPIQLAEKRTLSFANRRIIMGSTPTHEATSNVLRAYAESDMRIFEIACVECGDFHEPSWADIQWEANRPETAHYVCPRCGCVVEERHKAGMVENGRWRATRPKVTDHAGFRLSALVSTLANAAWSRLAKEFLAAKNHPDQLQVWTNTILAQGWREAAEELNEAELAARAEAFGLSAIPPDVLVVTCGVDVQRDRLELVFVGHGRDETFVLGMSTIWGSPHEDDVWEELTEALGTTWQHPNGGSLRVDAAAVDAGDGETMDRVIAYCRPRLGRKIVAIKGASGNRPAIKASDTKGSKLFIVGTDGLKSQLTSRLSRGRSIRFSADLEARFYEEIASERLIVKYVRGAPVRQWDRIPGRRAESLDCVIYALAVRGLLGLNLDNREADLRSQAAPAKRPTVVRSAWLER